MELINILEIKSPYGYRQFKLVKGDISKIDFPIDLLCVSAFTNGYNPIPGTLLGSLRENRHIDLHALATTPFLDLRNSQHTFITEQISDSCIKRILCVEMLGTNKSMDDILDSLLLSLFAAELKGLHIKTIMMPLLGTGRQGIQPAEILGSLLRKVEYLLTTSAQVEEVYLVAFQHEQAQQLNDAMNLLLKRSVSVFHKTQIIATVSSNIRQVIHDHAEYFKAGCYHDLLSLLKENDINAFQLAIVGRKICEQILNTVLKDNVHVELAKKITQLKSYDVPPWMISYFHMLRIYGNAYAHEPLQPADNIAQMSEQDIVIALFGLERIIDFYISQVLKSQS